MSLISFLKQIQETDRVVVGSADGAESPASEVQRVLEEFDSLARLEMPGEAPAISLPAATWAARTLHVGCQLLVFRERGPEEVSDMIATPCPQSACPATCYSVDLTFRYLPDLITLARRIAPDDPLVAGLLILARQWPLSSVGVADVGEVSVSAFWDDPSLRQLYLDRIVAHKDVARLANSIVADAARANWGLYPELAGQLAADLRME